MNIKTQIATTVALAAGLLALASTAVAAGPRVGLSDANERSVIAPSVQTSGSVLADAHQRSQVPALAVTTGGGLAAALPVASARLVGHVDVFEPVAGQPTRSASASVGSDFDWSAAAIGASSTLVLALLIGASVGLARRWRGEPLAR